MLDLIIKDGCLYDGLGFAPRHCDLGIEEGKIVAIAPRLSLAAREIRCARGLWITPGFIDIHTHYDLELEVAPGLAESVRHGVTSVVIGNCSLSIAIGSPPMLADMFQRVETFSLALIEKWLQTAVTWRTPREYLDHLRRLPLGSNVAALFGHSALRAHVMGLEGSLTKRATNGELTEMRRLAEEALDAGFIGISADMLPWHMMTGEWRGRPIPSQHADLNEYRMLAGVCRERDAVFQVTPNPQQLNSLIHILGLGLGIVRRPLRLTVLSALDSVSHRGLWRVFAPLLFGYNKILRSNLRFQTLTEPFTVYSDGPVTPLFEEFPSGVALNDCRSRREREALWHSHGFRERFRKEWVRGWRKTFHRQLEMMEIVSCPDAKLVGRSFAEIADERKRDPVDLFMDLLEEYDTELRWMGTGANDRLPQRLALMRHEHILPGFTDAGAHLANLGYYDGALSLLKQAVTTGFMSPEKAIARVTSEPARWFRLNTGVIREGGRADLVLINPQSLSDPISPQIEIIDDTLDGARRLVKRGSDQIIEAVYVKGRLVIERGQVTEHLGRETLGEVLEPSGLKDSVTALKRERRNRINAATNDHPFTDYWDIFVLKHQHPANLTLHLLGVVIFYGLLVFAWQSGIYWSLCLLPLSQIVGLLGHYLFERSHIDLQDAVFSLRASRCLNKLFFKVLMGRYGAERERVRAALREHQLRGDRQATATTSPAS